MAASPRYILFYLFSDNAAREVAEYLLDQASGFPAQLIDSAIGEVQIAEVHESDILEALAAADGDYLDSNPRQVKRFDNAFRLQFHVASTASDLEFREEQLNALAKWVAMRLRWPVLAEALDRETDLLATLEVLAYSTHSHPPDVYPDGHFSRWFTNGD